MSEQVAERNELNTLAEVSCMVIPTTSPSLIAMDALESPPLCDVSEEKNNGVDRDEKQATSDDNQLGCSLLGSMHCAQHMEVCETEENGDETNSNMVTQEETKAGLSVKKFHVFEDDQSESDPDNQVAATPTEHMVEGLSRRKRRFLKRIHKIEKRNIRKSSNTNNKRLTRLAARAGTETRPSSGMTSVRLCPALEEKENTGFLCDQKRHACLHNHNLCCSPVAHVVRRMFSPICSKSPLVRRESRSKRKVSYTEPSLSK